MNTSTSMPNICKYEKIQKVGQGTFGEVFKARCKKTRNIVAVKKLLMEDEKAGFSIANQREIETLQQLKHQHIIELLEICSGKASTQEEQATFYLVFTFCEHDLAELIDNRNIKLSLTHCKTLMKHLFSGLQHMHDSSIIHRDIKPANVLINEKGVLKIADFGLARPLFKSDPHLPQPVYTGGVVTLWYRSPELLLGERRYGPAVDIWSAGCIMAELWKRFPLIRGETEQRQLITISLLCGSITENSWPGIQNLNLFRQMQLPQGNVNVVRYYLSNFVRDVNAVCLIEKLLSLDPTARGTAKEALNHPFFFTEPEPKEDVRDLMGTIPRSMVECNAKKGIQSSELGYPSGRGLHCHRGRVHKPPRRKTAGVAVCTTA